MLMISNEIDQKLVKAKNGEINISELLKYLAEKEFFMPSVELNENAFLPLLFEREDFKMAAVFTDKTKMNLFDKQIKYVYKIKFKEIIQKTPETYGLVINPGSAEGLEILPHGIKNIKKDILNK